MATMNIQIDKTGHNGVNELHFHRIRWMTDSIDGWMVWLDGWLGQMALVGERVCE